MNKYLCAISLVTLSMTMSGCATGIMNTISEETSKTAVGANRLFAADRSEVASRYPDNIRDLNNLEDAAKYREYPLFGDDKVIQLGEIEQSLIKYQRLFDVARNAEIQFINRLTGIKNEDSYYKGDIENKEDGETFTPPDTHHPKDWGYYYKLSEFREAGWAASRQVCMYKLDQLGESRNDFQHGKDQVEIFSGLVATVMAISDVSAKAIGLFAAGESWLSTAQSASQDYLFITPDSKALERLVLVSQSEYRDAVRYAPEAITDKANKSYAIKSRYGSGFEEIMPPASFAQAVIDIQEFTRLCSANGLRNIITESVENATPVYNIREGKIEILGSENPDTYKSRIKTEEYENNKRDAEAAKSDLSIDIEQENNAIAIEQAKLDRLNNEANVVKAIIDEHDRLLANNSRLEEANAEVPQYLTDDIARSLEKISVSYGNLANARALLSAQRRDIRSLQQKIDIRNHELNAAKSGLKRIEEALRLLEENKTK